MHSSEHLNEIRDALNNFELDHARALLRETLKENPSAEAYYLASQAAVNAQQRQKFLEKALELDPFHEEANMALQEKGTLGNSSQGSSLSVGPVLQNQLPDANPRAIIEVPVPSDATTSQQWTLQWKPIAILVGLLAVGIMGIVMIAGIGSSFDRPQPQVGPDSDGDWVSDLDEAKFGTDDSKWDTDQDGATDFEEIFIVGSDPTVAEEDTDGDFFRDVTEKNLYGTNPNEEDEDRDQDSVPDSVEIKRGSDPGKIDTDNDLLSDYLEIYLTGTDPATADPINEHGFPEPLESWLPQHLQNADCKVEVSANIDQLDIVDPEEADGPNDVNVGDEIIMYYGLWLNAHQEDDLFFSFSKNSAHSDGWRGSGIIKGDQITRFSEISPLKSSCGDVATLAIQALESDAPWGGDRNFGLYRDERYLIFSRIPMEWDYGSTGMFFEGTGGDSSTYQYNVDYTFTVKLQP